ncbi:helix-turn-helix domain-containing protein [Phenylobacterium sp.]|uniref:Crp/Fnr family transcriptional regulator n=1 Tax=Phenylobacterium sp. TaxID=1871053 RepID=UPI0028110EEA|nr:helix-turn-helix domain-containing protein [Phenylobacterium sp.]
MSAVAQATPHSPLTFSALGLEDRQVEQVRAFWRTLERFGPGVQLRCREGQGCKRGVIVSGWACEMRILPDGRRQIFSFLLPGDPFVIEENTDIGGRGIVALTRLETIDWTNPLLGVADGRDALARAVEEASRIKQDRMLDQMVRIGRLTARERLLHLLLELYYRLEAVGLVRGDTFRIPLTQALFADALGLSLVHINRTLTQLRREGHILLRGGSVTLLSREKLSAIAFFHAHGAPPAM